MMRTNLQLTFVLFSILNIIRMKTEDCPKSVETQIRFLYQSYRNTSGHRLIKGSFERPAAKLRASDGESLQITEKVIDAGTKILKTEFEITADSARRRLDYDPYFGIGYYKIHLQAVTWAEAVEICQSEGTNLLVINSEAEADVARGYLSRGYKVPNETYEGCAWNGFYKVTEGKYRTIYGTPLEETGYNKWIPGDYSGDEHDCGNMNKNAMICVDPCSGKQKFICEQTI